MFFSNFSSEQPYWNYRDQSSYLTTDERHSTRQSVEGGTQGSFDSPSYAASSLRSYDSYSTSGKCIKMIAFSFETSLRLGPI